MVEYDESIYNLIPKEQYVPEKAKRYKSQYPANLAPTASTFGLKTTSKPVCSNLSGKFNIEGGSHSHVAGGATMGAAKGALKPCTTTFRKKNTGQPVLVDRKEGKYSSARRRPNSNSWSLWGRPTHLISGYPYPYVCSDQDLA